MTSKQNDKCYEKINLVLITQLDEKNVFEDIQDIIIKDKILKKRELYYFRWIELIELFEIHHSTGKEKFINELFLKYLGDKMADRKEIKEQRIKDVKEVMIHSTDSDWWEHVKKTNIVCQDNNSPDAQYVAIYRNSPISAITHIAKVRYTENNIPARESYKDYPEIIQKGTERGWIDDLHKVYYLEELIELPVRIEKEKGDRGVVRNKWFKELTEILKARKLSDLRR